MSFGSAPIFCSPRRRRTLRRLAKLIWHPATTDRQRAHSVGVQGRQALVPTGRRRRIRNGRAD